MADFSTWTQENLVKFAFEATQLIHDKEIEVRGLKSDLKSCMEAYRKLNATIKEEPRINRSVGYSTENNTQSKEV